MTSEVWNQPVGLGAGYITAALRGERRTLWEAKDAAYYREQRGSESTNELQTRNWARQVMRCKSWRDSYMRCSCKRVDSGLGR